MAFVLILVVAAALRFYRLPELPLGLHYDEAANVILAGEIAHGAKTPVFISSYTGKEVLFFYWAALWERLLGETPLALRLSGALVGLATVAAAVWAVHELLHDRRDALWVALLTGALLATSFWHLVFSRYGFRAITQPLLQALTVAALWRGFRLAALPGPATDRRGVSTDGPPSSTGTRWFALAGLFLGLTAHTYLAARAFPIPLGAALLAVLIAERGHRRVRLGQFALLVAVAALVLAPLAYYWWTHPGSFLTRTQQIAASNWATAWAGIRACLGMFFVQGDPYIRFNFPNRPIFGPVTATLFCLGLGVVVWEQIVLLRGRRRFPFSSPAVLADPLGSATWVFLLVYVPTMLLPSALAVGDITPSNLRAIGLLPFIYVLPALGLSVATSWVSNQRWSAVLRWVLLALVLVLGASGSAAAYFRDWATSAALYYAADGDLADVARYLNQTGGQSDAIPYVASVHYRHPTLAALARDYKAIRWLTGGRTLVFPADRKALLVFPRSAADDVAWIESVLSDDALVAAPLGPDGQPAFRVYEIGPELSLSPTRVLTANLGHVAQLLGYDVVGQPTSGGHAEVAVWWRVLAAPQPGDYGPIVRLMDPWGFSWGVASPFHYPAEQWSPGEVIVDHLSIPVEAGAPPGDYDVLFSFYSAQADANLPKLDPDGRYAGAWVRLPVYLARADGQGISSEGLGIRAWFDQGYGDLTLLGANLDTQTLRPGERLYLTLYWQAKASGLPNHTVHITLGGTELYAGAPIHGTYPFSGWAGGELVVDRYSLRVPLQEDPGGYPFVLVLDDPGTDARIDYQVSLGTVTVQPVRRVLDMPPIAHPLSATLGRQVELLGYDLAQDQVTPGGTLTLTLYWRALEEMEENYTVFTHLLAPDGTMTGQRDGQPVGATYPTSLWMPGEIVVDVREIPIRADAASGANRLEVGMYISDTGIRLTLSDSGEDGVFLQEVAVVVP